MLQNGSILVKWDVPLSLQGSIELTPNIVDADHDREPIGLQVQDIGLPAGGEITHGVAGDARVADADVLRGEGRAEQGVDEGDIAIAKVPADGFGDRTNATAVCDSITGHEQRAVRMDLHGILYGIASPLERRGRASQAERRRVTLAWGKRPRN
jgi:hypothetical protein